MKKEIIQIGVGGYSSSGKTLLIDAMMGLFDSAWFPYYMPKRHAIKLVPTGKPPFCGAYQPYYKLRRDVSDRFHILSQTVDKGDWKENTYYARVTINKNSWFRVTKKKKILLIRNLPGEMFIQYFKPIGATEKSPKDIFDELLDRNEAYKSIYKDILNFQYSKNEEHIWQRTGKWLRRKWPLKRRLKNRRLETGIRDVEEKIEELKKAFLDKIAVQGAEKVNLSKNFAAFLFYVSSDFNLYCLKSADISNDEIKNLNANIHPESPERFFVCFTQFDDVLSTPMLPVIEADTHSQSSKNGTDRLSDLDRYWLTMELIYRDFSEKKPPIYVNEEKWKGIQNIIKRVISYKWFVTSIAYHGVEEKFYKFEKKPTAHSSDTPSSQGVVGDGVWTQRDNWYRTSIGVLELMLHMFEQMGVEINNTKIKLDRKFNNVYKKVHVPGKDDDN